MTRASMTFKLLKPRRFYTAIFVLALIARLALFFVNYHAAGNDIRNMVGGRYGSEAERVAHDAGIGGDCYVETSDNMIHGRGFSCEVLPPYEPYQYGVPAYPLYISLILMLTGSPAAVIFIQIVLGSLLVVLGTYLARVILEKKNPPEHVSSAEIFIGLILALAPSHLEIAQSYSPEIIFMVFFLPAFYFLARYLQDRRFKHLAWCAVTLGIATLAKPTAEYIPIIIIAFLLWKYVHRSRGVVSTASIGRKKLAIHLVGMLAIFVAVLSPWIYRNYTGFGTIALSTQAERAVYVALLPSVISIEKGISFNEAQAPLLAKHPNNFTFANSKGMKTYLVTELSKYPAADVKMAALSAFTFFTHDGVLTFLQNMGITPASYLGAPSLLLAFKSPLGFARLIGTYIASPLALVLIFRIFFIAITVLSFAGLVILYKRRENSDAADFAVVLVIYFVLTTMTNGLSVTSRFRIPIDWIILAFAWVGLSALVKTAAKWLRRSSYARITSRTK